MAGLGSGPSLHFVQITLHFQKLQGETGSQSAHAANVLPVIRDIQRAGAGTLRFQGIRFFSIHRSWEEWMGMLLGVLIGLSPWLAGEQDHPAVLSNAFLVGMLVFGLAELEYVSLQRWEEAGELALGLWLIASPFIFGFAGTGELRYWHFILDAVVALLALLELWQDWTLSDKELAQHG